MATTPAADEEAVVPVAVADQTVAISSSNSNNSESQRTQQQQQQEQQHQGDDASTIMSLAAMSTTTATTTGALLIDDVSSMGETTQTHHSTSRRKRKDDCSESRCTVTSEESVRSRSRRRRHRLIDSTVCHHRWLERIDRTAATSHAPIRPNRSDGDAFLPTLPQATASMMATTPLSSAGATDGNSIFNFHPHHHHHHPQHMHMQQRTLSATLPRIGGGLFHHHQGPTNETPTAEAIQRAGGGIVRGTDADVSAREVARCQSMSLPPTRPTRTRDDSKTDLMVDDDDDENSSSDQGKKEKLDGRKKKTGDKTPKPESGPDKEKNQDHASPGGGASLRNNNAEIDPYMFARLLHGQQLGAGAGGGGARLPLTPPLHRSESQDNAASSIPPKKPRRRSDADCYAAARERQQKQNPGGLMRFNTVATTGSIRGANVEKKQSPNQGGPPLMRFNTVAATSAIRIAAMSSAAAAATHHHHGVIGRLSESTCCHGSGRPCHHSKCQSMRGETCSHTVSPKPPAKPHRTFDDATLDGLVAAGLPPIPLPPNLVPPHAPLTLEAPSPTNVPRVSDQSAALAVAQDLVSPSTTILNQESTADGDKEGRPQQLLKKQASAASVMDTEEAGSTDKAHTSASDDDDDDVVEVLVVQGDDEDDTEVSVPASMKEYDPDLFARLLNGDSSDNTVTLGAGLGIHTAAALSSRTAEERSPPPPLVARVSSGATTKPPGYDRFDNSASSSIHPERAVKSSHPPMRPRRSMDECLWSISMHTSSLAAAAAAACVAQAGETSTMTSHGMPPPISPRKRSFRRPSRRSTLPMASEMPSSGNTNSNGNDNVDGKTDAEPLDASTQEASLEALSQPLEESYGDGGEAYCEERDDEYEHPLEVAGGGTDGSYSRILPSRRRRRVVRRFTMPSKGGGSLSPQAKKRRTVGRSHSCRGPEDGMTTPAA